jgi:hypothetical protein
VIVENTKLTDCYYEKKDWRACKQEVSLNGMNSGDRGVASDAEMLPRHDDDDEGQFELTQDSDGDVQAVLAATWE